MHIPLIVQGIKQVSHGLSQYFSTFLPVRNGLFEADRLGRSITITVSVFRPDVERDAEVAGFLPDLVIAYHTGKAVLVAKGLVGGDNALDMIVHEEALCPLAGHFVHRVDEEHLVPALLGFVHPADDDAGFHGRVVKEIGTETQHALHHVVGNQLLAHG